MPLVAAGYPVMHGHTPSILRLSMAMDKEPFTDPRVSQAVLHAIPHGRILRTALADRGARATGFFNPDDITSNNGFQRSALNLDLTRKLLREAGKEGIAFDFWYSTALPYTNDIAILIAHSLKATAVTANLKPTPTLQLLDAVRARINGGEGA
jgi:peptide/nickel transport system substrate-binding protein